MSNFILKRLASCTVSVMMLLLTSSFAYAETYYFHTDHLGTPQSVTDSDQQIAWQADYDPFGEAAETVSAVEQNLRFPGQYWDRETRFHYNYFRTYDPVTGRYTQSDPIGLNGGLSTFGYSIQNPISTYDFFGLSWIRVLPRSMQNPVRNLPQATQSQWRNTPQATRSSSKKHKNKSSNDVPSWARGARPKNGENGTSFAERMCNDRYGAGNYERGPKSPFNQIKKWGDRDFQRTPLPSESNQVVPIPDDPWLMYDPAGPMYNPNYYFPSVI